MTTLLKLKYPRIKSIFKITEPSQAPIIGDVSFVNKPGKFPMIIFCHGYKGFKDWGAWNNVAKSFQKKDIHFSKFNFSLNGGTLENPIDFPDLKAFARNTYTQEVNDLSNVINLMVTEHKNITSSIFLVGHSRGGGIALLNSLNDKIDGVITWASVADYESRFPKGKELENWIKSGVRYITNSRTKQQMPHNINFYNDFLKNKEKLSIENVVKKLKKPQLIIHGERDQAVDVSQAYLLKKWNPSAELKTFKASHTFNSSHPWTKDSLPNELDLAVNYTADFILNYHD